MMCFSASQSYDNSERIQVGTFLFVPPVLDDEVLMLSVDELGFHRTASLSMSSIKFGYVGPLIASLHFFHMFVKCKFICRKVP